MTQSLLASAERTFRLEIAALNETIGQLDAAAFAQACEMILASSGRVVVTGVGKSGHIGNKIASTLASTGTASFFLHPSEAAHGDLGMVGEEDIVMMLSKSGRSDELLAILPGLARIETRIIAITCATDSPIADAAKHSGGVVLRVTCSEEACPHDLAPTASTTVMLALGDALAVALLEARDFSVTDFARLHPAGALGRRLTLHVSDVMKRDEQVPRVTPDATLLEVMREISHKRVGATAVVDGEQLIGIITDGDLRRYFQSQAHVDIAAIHASALATSAPRTVKDTALATEALRRMEESPKVLQLLVVDDAGTLVGVIHMHDLVRAGIRS